MPKIFKKNKYALLGANLIIIFFWIILSRYIFNLLGQSNENLIEILLTYVINFFPPIWITWFLWIKRGGIKR